MIENLAGEEMRTIVIETDLRAFLANSHRHMSALCDQRVEPRDATIRQNLRGKRKEDVGVIVASLIGNDRQHAFARRDFSERFFDNLAQFFGAERKLRRALAD